LLANEDPAEPLRMSAMNNMKVKWRWKENRAAKLSPAARKYTKQGTPHAPGIQGREDL